MDYTKLLKWENQLQKNIKAGEARQKKYIRTLETVKHEIAKIEVILEAVDVVKWGV
jgi:uncharacterized protein with GYD domain